MPKITIGLTEASDDDEGSFTIGIKPPIENLADLATVLLMISRAQYEIAQSTVKALDTIGDSLANKGL